MPTYEYQCSTCGRQFEYFQSISAEALKQCPPEICEAESPGNGQVARMISRGSGLIFNGSGFYLTDYVKKSGGSDSGSA